VNAVIAPDAPLHDPFSPDWQADPAPYLNRLRETDPVHWSKLGYWVVSRYDDVAALLRDPRLSYANAAMGDIPADVDPDDLAAVVRVFTNSFNLMDPPDHTRLRRLVAKAFAAQATERERPRIQATVDELLDAAERRGEMDLVGDFAYPLPIIITTEIIGIPDVDRERFREWFARVTRLMDPEMSPETFAAALAAYRAATEFLQALVDERRARPADDLVTALVQAEDAGSVMNDDELVANLLVIFGAAGTTTKSLISRGVIELLRQPDQLALLRADPALIGTAVDELLRFQPTAGVGFLNRANADIELEGGTIKAGDRVSLSLSAANRDPAQFTDPDRLDITRTENNHLSFGAGAHFCIGANIARAEAQIAIGTLVQRFPALALDKDDMEREPIPSNDWKRVTVRLR
jgi:cytochrome P450